MTKSHLIDLDAIADGTATHLPGAGDATIALAQVAAQAAANIKGENIVALDVAARLGLVEVFLLVSATNERQLQAIADAIEEQLWLAGAKTHHREGDGEAQWVLLDYGDLVIHLQHQESRTLFALDKLWYDCPQIPLAE